MEARHEQFKYYDWTNEKYLTKNDGCKYENWSNDYKDYPFAIHPEGFFVFLSPSHLEKSDEYEESDPYTFDQNIDSPYHRRRIEGTKYLIGKLNVNNSSKIKILDVGCGEGIITAKINEMDPIFELTGVDYSITAITSAVRKFKNIDFAVTDAVKLPFTSNYFNIIICNNLWEHVYNPMALLSEISKVTNNGGYLILSTPSRYKLGNLLRALIGKPIPLISEHVTEYTIGQIIEQLKTGGYKVIEIFSKPLKPEIDSLKKIILNILIKPVFSLYLKLINSHHSLEGTVFFLAQKTTD